MELERRTIVKLHINADEIHNQMEEKDPSGISWTSAMDKIRGGKVSVFNPYGATSRLGTKLIHICAAPISIRQKSIHGEGYIVRRECIEGVCQPQCINCDCQLVTDFCNTCPYNKVEKIKWE